MSFVTLLPMAFGLGELGRRLLPKVRDWMQDNSWVVNEIVIGLFIALTISDLA